MYAYLLFVKKYESLNRMKLPSKQKMPLFSWEDDICLQFLIDQRKCVNLRRFSDDASLYLESLVRIIYIEFHKLFFLKILNDIPQLEAFLVKC